LPRGTEAVVAVHMTCAARRMFPTPPSTKKCLVYCGDDLCTCEANPKLVQLRSRLDETELDEPGEGGE